MQPFDTNVFTFGMIYCKIIFKTYPFDDCPRNKVLKKINNSQRSKLPSNCDKLTKFIKESQNLNPLH